MSFRIYWMQLFAIFAISLSVSAQQVNRSSAPQLTNKFPQANVDRNVAGIATFDGSLVNDAFVATLVNRPPVGWRVFEVGDRTFLSVTILRQKQMVTLHFAEPQPQRRGSSRAAAAVQREDGRRRYLSVARIFTDITFHGDAEAWPMTGEPGSYLETRTEWTFLDSSAAPGSGGRFVPGLETVAYISIPSSSEGRYFQTEVHDGDGTLLERAGGTTIASGGGEGSCTDKANGHGAYVAGVLKDAREGQLMTAMRKASVAGAVATVVYLGRGRLGLSSGAAAEGGAAATGTFSAEMIEPALKAAEEVRDEVVTEFHKALYMTICHGMEGFTDAELSVSAMDLQEPGTGPLADYREVWVCVEWSTPPDEVVDDGEGGFIVTGSPRRCVSYAPIYVPSNI